MSDLVNKAHPLFGAMLTSFCPGASSIMSEDSNGSETTQILKPFFFRLPTIWKRAREDTRTINRRC